MKRTWLAAIAGILAAAGVSAAGQGPEVVNDLVTAFDKAKSDGRLIFIALLKDGDRNCQALKDYIDSGSVKLPGDRFMYVALNADDTAERKTFKKDYPMVGQTLPQVAIVDANGKALATRPGPGKAEDFQKLVRDAMTKAGIAPAAEKPAAAKGKAADDKNKAAAQKEPEKKPEMRTFTSATGQTRAFIVEVMPEHVIFQNESGKLVKFPIADLSKTDQEYIEKFRQTQKNAGK